MKYMGVREDFISSSNVFLNSVGNGFKKRLICVRKIENNGNYFGLRLFFKLIM